MRYVVTYIHVVNFITPKTTDMSAVFLIDTDLAEKMKYITV